MHGDERDGFGGSEYEGSDHWDTAWDGRLTNEDFVDRPRRETRDETGDPARPLYDGRPGRDPYDRGGGYRRVSEAVWDRAREDYLDGEAAETVCARHGLARSTFHQRARDQGWRRIDQPEPAPLDPPIDMAAEVAAGLPDYVDMARHALVRLNRAVLAGRAIEAARWMRLHRQLSDMARAQGDIQGDAPAEAPAETTAASAARTRDKPAPRFDLDEAVLRRMRRVETLARAMAGSDMSNPIVRRAIDLGIETIRGLPLPSVKAAPDDSDYSDYSDCFSSDDGFDALIVDSDPFQGEAAGADSALE